jgi:hypothetical protein
VPPSVKGMQLCHDFYFECVAPLMERHFPKIHYSAARLGVGSDVLGFDNHRSIDHDWGPQVDLFFSTGDFEAVGDSIYDVLSKKLPFTFKGFSNTQSFIGYALTQLIPTSRITLGSTQQTGFQKSIGCAPQNKN